MLPCGIGSECENANVVYEPRQDKELIISVARINLNDHISNRMPFSIVNCLYSKESNEISVPPTMCQ